MRIAEGRPICLVYSDPEGEYVGFRARSANVIEEQGDDKLPKLWT